MCHTRNYKPCLSLLMIVTCTGIFTRIGHGNEDFNINICDFYFTCKHLSPAEGSSLHPTVTTGVEGGALFTVFLCSFSIVLTLPHVCPATRMSPFVSVPCRTITVAIGLHVYRNLNSCYTQARVVGR